ncbi:transketolase family protein [Candidatus Nomurabacteria bacterium]|nr:transketolase family protein [Candidatus Nomurabacteria bacterium]
MLNPKLKLNPKVLGDDCEQEPIRKGFGRGLLSSGEKDSSIVALCADLTESTQMHLFKERFPERFVEIGVAEQNLVAVSSGMSAMGKYPFCSSYAMFSPGRNWEQIRTTICYNDRGVCIVGSHAGISVGPDGGTHQALEDISLMRVLPNMIVVSPCDSIEAEKATEEIAKLKRPVYLRLAREKTGIITTKETPFKIGKGEIFFASDGLPNVGIIATGSLVRNAILAANALEKKGIKSKVLNISTIKPLDEEAVLTLAKETRAIVTIEEHQIAGGLGSAVSELLGERLPTRIKRLGINDEFGQSGKPEELLKFYGLDEEGIKNSILDFVGNR